MIKTLLFVYNANSNRWNKLFDIIHKAISPETYTCDLCKLTHGVFKEKERWAVFKKQSKFRMTFLYKDQFLRLHGVENKQFSFPIVLQHKNGKFRPILTNQELQGFDETKDLIALLEELLKNQGATDVKAAS